MSGAHKLPMDPLMNIKTKIIVYRCMYIYIEIHRNFFFLQIFKWMLVLSGAILDNDEWFVISFNFNKLRYNILWLMYLICNNNLRLKRGSIGYKMNVYWKERKKISTICMISEKQDHCGNIVWIWKIWVVDVMRMWLKFRLNEMLWAIESICLIT